MQDLYAGYVTYTGYALTENEARRYNQLNEDIDKATYPATKEALKDLRHKAFCLMAEQKATPR